MSEHDEQAALFGWVELQANLYPPLRLLHAIPNGGHRHPVVAAKMKAEGVKRGVPDLCLPVARGGFHGLYIEMKFGRNRPSDEQLWWLEALAGQGYKTAVCWSFEAAQRIILEYLRLNPSERLYAQIASTEAASIS
ncbi:MAG: VRR-NUC domain-containing protein [Chloroflexi bacterium]|nr:VRR-NUC domain-containing protein [Chloroflexota bacterium]